MEKIGMIDYLVEFGLSRQESTIYLCLLEKGELTGYEVAKQTGISRSNVYSGLASLVESGGAYLIEGVASKYIGVDLEEFCENRIRKLKEVKKYLIENIQEKPNTSEGYITIEGYKHITNKIHHMLINAKQRVYFSAPFHFIIQWRKEIEELVKRNIKVVIITDKLMDEEWHKKVIIYIKDVQVEYKKTPIRLIIDSEFVLTGDIEESINDTCLYSGQKNFVNVFKEAMSNEIKLIELIK